MNALYMFSDEVDAYYRQCVDELLKRKNETVTLNRHLQQRRTTSHRFSEGSENDDVYEEIPTLKRIVELNGWMKIAQEKLAGAEQRWEALVARSKFLTDLVEGPAPPQSRVVDPSSSIVIKAYSHILTCGGKINYVWKKYVRSMAYRFLALYAVVLSGTILWSEATLSLPMNLSPFAMFLRLFNGSESTARGLLFKMAALIPLLYMSLCVYTSLIKLSAFGMLTLRGQKQSHAVALMFNAQYLVRLQFPLGYNYLLMLKYDTSSTTCAFSTLMSNMSTVPFFGTSFSVYAPLLILGLCGFTICNIYPRLVALMGFEHEDGILMGDKETLESKVNEGITLLRRHEERTEAPGSPKRTSSLTANQQDLEKNDIV